MVDVTQEVGKLQKKLDQDRLRLSKLRSKMSKPSYKLKVPEDVGLAKLRIFCYQG
jgi:hypothetical protein